MRTVLLAMKTIEGRSKMSKRELVKALRNH
jgi:hypothetical protein